MTVEIRTGAQRSEQKGTAGTQKCKEGRNNGEKWTDKRKLSFTKRAQDSRVSSRHALYGSEQISCHSEMTLKGGMECTQQSILNFMPAAPFKSLKKTLIQVSVTF